MLLRTAKLLHKSTTCFNCRILSDPRRLFSQEVEKAYSDDQKEKILEVINQSDDKELSRYDITRSKIKKIAQWKDTYGHLKSLGDMELIDKYTEKSAKKLFDSILKGPLMTEAVKKVKNKIRGQVLQPPLSEVVRQNCKTVLALYVSVNSVCWTLVQRDNYEVIKWDYYAIDYPESKKLQITDIVQIAWKVTRQIPHADLYVMKAEATTLRASGSDPNNPKVLSVNLQKSQIIAMLVALINTRTNKLEDLSEDKYNKAIDRDMFFKNMVYFLRPTLPYRLYGTLVGNEKVSTDQTVELILQSMEQTDGGEDENVPCISKEMKSNFRAHNELQRDMLGHCLLLALTFMDLCVYKKQESINKLINRGE